VRCLRCNSGKISRISTRKQYDCDSCRYRFSITTGTLFHDSHLPLSKWFLAILLMCEAKNGISANQMKRLLGVAHKTAWYLCHRIREAMKESSPGPQTDRKTTERARAHAANSTLVESFHRISPKHLDRYLDEFAFRHNNRTNPSLFRDTLVRLVHEKHMPYEQLTG
jgi:transposase-like protein